MPDLALRGVSVERDGKSLLSGIDLTFPSGFLGSVVGPTGSGKSTLLRLLNRLIDPTAGEVTVDGEPAIGIDPGALRRSVALLWPGMTLLEASVRENLAVFGSPEDEIRDAMETVALPEAFLDRTEEQLSAGERARVLVARSLLGRPQALVLDEVISNLDPDSAAALLDALGALHRERGLQVIHVSHNLAHVRRLGGECVAMRDGRVAECGPVEEVLARVNWLD